MLGMAARFGIATSVLCLAPPAAADPLDDVIDQAVTVAAEAAPDPLAAWTNEVAEYLLIKNPLSELIDPIINGPWVALWGRDLIGNGIDDFTGSDPGLLAGVFGDLGDGGFLFGNGGDGADGTAAHPDGFAGGDSGLFGNGGDGGNGVDGGYGGAGGNAEMIGDGGQGGAGAAGAIGGIGGIGGSVFGQAGVTGDGTQPLGSVPVRVYYNDPAVNVSIGGGRVVPLLVDTGSSGLFVPYTDVGWQDLLSPLSFNTATFAGGEHVWFETVHTTVDFGNGMAPEPIIADVELFAWPRPFDFIFDPISPIAGIVGIGPGAVGPEDEPVNAALPGHLSDGVLIDEPQGLISFGPNPLPERASVDGSPFVDDLTVQLGDGPLQPIGTVALDSGGKSGVFPSSAVSGTDLTSTRISVYQGQTLLYSFIPSVFNGTSPDIFDTGTVQDLYYYANTGNTPFLYNPVYISDGPTDAGRTIFDVLPGR